MIDWIAGAYTSLTAAKDITKTMLDIKEAAAISAKALELNGVILEVQDKLFNARTERDEMQSRIRELEDRLVLVDDLKKYKLVQFETGTLVYGLSNEVESQDVEVSHYICPNCYSAGRKAILQPNQNYLVCTIPDCKFVVAISPSKPRPPRNWRTI